MQQKYMEVLIKLKDYEEKELASSSTPIPIIASSSISSEAFPLDRDAWLVEIKELKDQVQEINGDKIKIMSKMLSYLVNHVG